MYVLYLTDYMDKDGGACTEEFVHRRKSPRLNPSCSANVSLPPRPPPKTKSRPTEPSVTEQVQQESENRHCGPVRTRSGARIWMGPRPPRVVGSAVPSQTKAAAPGFSQPPVQTEQSASQSPSGDQPGSSRSPPRVVGSADPSQTKAAAPLISQPPVQNDLSAAQSPSAAQPQSSRSPPPGVGSADPSGSKAAAPQISQPPVQNDLSVAQSPSAAQPQSSRSPPRGNNADLSPPRGFADQSSEPSDEQCEDGQSSDAHFYVGVDDGSRRCILRRPLRECPKALAACGQGLVESASEVSAGQNKRKRNKEKSDVKCGRGLAKPRDPAAPGDRPGLLIVGDGEFTSRPMCTQVITTIRILTLENLPEPFRSYKMFPTKARLLILEQFMQRYSWGHEEDIKRCLDVFENIAAEAYQRELTETRATCKKKYGVDKEVWKNHPPKWCKNVEAWKGLCDIWSTPKWDQISTTNRENRTKSPDVVYHVAGSRSTYKHKQALISETGQSVGLLDVFDRTHTRRSEEGKVYVNTRAQEAAVNVYSIEAESKLMLWTLTLTMSISILLQLCQCPCYAFLGSGSAGTADDGHKEVEEDAQPSTTIAGGGENPQPSPTNTARGEEPTP
ncbi:Plant transposase (Ptta/En/Spm family) [Carex littledalei]|uniref:Plant transposase (Ptta/En/Spm family) n=1 Tax=Carex littledalei TaxID=544730 RepID=A0A833QT85_9POAL|nr:Plant transposase (Ptta/En/Spm family) [Carex littledalei]